MLKTSAAGAERFRAGPADWVPAFRKRLPGDGLQKNFGGYGMRRKSLIAIFIAVLFTAIYISPFSAAASTYKLVTLEDGDFYKACTTVADTVADLLKENGVTLEDRDTVNFGLAEPLVQGMEIVVSRGFYVKLIVDGAEEQLKISAGTQMGPLVLALQKERGKTFDYAESPARYIRKGDVLNLSSLTEKTVTYTRIIPFDSEYVDAPSLDVGVTEVAQAGVTGECEITEVVTYSGGMEVSRAQKSVTVTKEPVKEIVNVGVKLAPENSVSTAQDDASADFEYVKEYEMSATAYTASTCGKAPGSRGYGVTASGQKARRGLVAVDTNVIPMGTKLFIEGYGYAEAADTGGAIKGMKIDLYMDTLSECLAFGRETVKVYVLP